MIEFITKIFGIIFLCFFVGIGWILEIVGISMLTGDCNDDASSIRLNYEHLSCKEYYGFAWWNLFFQIFVLLIILGIYFSFYIIIIIHNNRLSNVFKCQRYAYTINFFDIRFCCHANDFC